MFGNLATVKQYELTLVLDEKELDILKGWTQNPRMDKESLVEKEFRANLWTALHPPQAAPK